MCAGLVPCRFLSGCPERRLRNVTFLFWYWGSHANPEFQSRKNAQTGEVLPGPEFLAKIGPLVPATIGLPDYAQRAYIERNEQPPSPVNGFVLIDTGATTTCIDVEAAKTAALPTVGVAKMSSASHSNYNVPTFSGKIICPTLNIDVQEGMGANLSSVGNGLIILIGRDILKSAVFTYNGSDGSFFLAM